MRSFEHSRAQALMSRSMADQRSTPRTPVCLSAIVTSEDDGLEQQALLRDVSESGVFYYCKFEPKLGSSVSVRFNAINEGETSRMLVRGNVVRIVRYPGAATGVAIEVSLPH